MHIFKYFQRAEIYSSRQTDTVFQVNKGIVNLYGLSETEGSEKRIAPVIYASR